MTIDTTGDLDACTQRLRRFLVETRAVGDLMRSAAFLGTRSPAVATEGGGAAGADSLAAYIRKIRSEHGAPEFTIPASPREFGT